MNQVKLGFKVPIAVGFGISKPEHINLIRPYADIAVLGSSVIDIMNKAGKNYQKEVEYFLQDLMKANI